MNILFLKIYVDKSGHLCHDGAMQTKPDQRTSIVLTHSDAHLVDKLRRKLEKDGGKVSVSAIVRRALRALAERLSLPL